MASHTFKKIERIGIVTKSNLQEKWPVFEHVLRELGKYKKELYLDEHSAPIVAKKFANASAKSVTELAPYLHLHHGKGYTKNDLLSECDLVLILGGDGTILKTASHATPKKTLIFGINVGNLGFLSETTPSKFPEHLKKLFAHQYTLDVRSLLRVTQYRDGHKINTFLALNEAVINQGSFARLIEMNIQINKRRVVTFKADGLIISSPTGSTGHSISAGGPIVHPFLPAIILTPICPASLTMRPIIIPNDRQITLNLATRRLESQDIGLTIDGQNCIPLHYGDEIKVRKSSRCFSLVRIKGNKNYYHLLRSKLHWGR